MKDKVWIAGTSFENKEKASKAGLILFTLPFLLFGLIVHRNVGLNWVAITSYIITLILILCLFAPDKKETKHL